MMTSQYPLTTAEKINHASQILSRGLLIINKYIPNEFEHINFREAEANGNVKEYFLNALYLSSEQRVLLSNYYEINSIIGKMRVEQSYELSITGDSSFLLYKQAVEIGITEEKRVIEKYFEDHPNYNKLVNIVNRQIEIIKESADYIISLDSDFSIQRSFAEKEKCDLEYLKTLIQDELCLFALRKINFDFNGNCFDIIDKEIIQLLEKEFFTWARMEVEYSDMPEIQKKQVFNDNQLFLTFFTQKIRGLDSAILLTLWYNRTPNEYKFKIENLFILWSIARMYDEDRNSSPEFCIYDIISIKNIYLYILNLFQKIEQEDKDQDVSELIEIMIFSVKSLANLYIELYEYEKSIELYKSLFLDTKLINSTLHDLDYIIVLIVTCYEKINVSDAISFILEIMSDTSNFFAIPINIDDNIKDILELKLAEILSEHSEIIPTFNTMVQKKKTINFRNHFINKIIVINSEGIESDNINSELLLETTVLINEFAEKIQTHHELGDIGIIAQLTVFKSTPLGENADFITKKIGEVEKLLSENKYSVEKIELELWKTKAEFLRNNPNCLILFKKNLQLAEQYGIPIENLTYWYSQYIRANILQIKNNFDTSYKEIEMYALKASNLLLKISISDFGKDFKILSTQVEFEILITCILLNIEAIYTGEMRTMYVRWTPETEITESSINENKILKLIWNLIIHRNKYLNAFYSYKQTDNYFSKRFTELQFENQENLYHYYVKLEQKEYKEKVIQLSNEFKKMQVPYLKDSNFLTELEEPSNRSLSYFAFTKQDNMRGMIAISYHPIGHHNSGTKFQYKQYENVSSLENVLSNSDDIKTLFRNNTELKNFYDYLIEPFALTDNLREYSINRQLREIGFVDEGSFKAEIEKVDIYSDSFLNRLSFEYINTDNNFPIGILKKISYVANKPQREIYPNFTRPIVIFSEIPDYTKYNEKNNLKFLEYSSQEVDSIKKAAKGQKIISLLGTEANISNFYEILEDRPSILHFVTHGVGDVNLPPETSALLLAPDGKGHFLSYLDILKLDLSFIDLVILSACNSSIGKIDRSISMKGLAYAFLYAGVGNVLATKTEVSDKLTSPFISKFYNYLFDNNSISESLRLTREYFHLTQYKDFDINLSTEKKELLSKQFLSSWNLWS